MFRLKGWVLQLRNMSRQELVQEQRRIERYGVFEREEKLSFIANHLYGDKTHLTK
jgi:hypothetical protein